MTHMTHMTHFVLFSSARARTLGSYRECVMMRHASWCLIEVQNGLRFVLLRRACVLTSKLCAWRLLRVHADIGRH